MAGKYRGRYAWRINPLTGNKVRLGGRSRGKNWRNVGIAGAALVGGALMAPSFAGSGASGGSGNGFWQNLIKSGAGGLQAGLSKRIEAQIAGDKGRFASGVGYQLPTAIQAASDQAAMGYSQQSESQGNYLSFQAEQAYEQRRWQTEENAKDRALTLMLSKNGDTSNGQSTLLTPLSNYGDKLHADLTEFYRKRHARTRHNRPTDIGTTTDGRHYGSNW